MRTIHRTAVGAFIFSSDDCLLLGESKPGGVYQGKLLIPGGGLEDGETELEGAKREVREETGLDIDAYEATITPLDDIPEGESGKVLRETGERVLVRMRFYDFVVHIAKPSAEIPVTAGDDYFHNPRWVPTDRLAGIQMTDSMRHTLQKLGYLPS